MVEVVTFYLSVAINIIYVIVRNVYRIYHMYQSTSTKHVDCPRKLTQAPKCSKGNET